ncbi:unnamed protein product [Caenorhabditis brenneri]
MIEEPLSYPSRRVLLEHLDFNTRFHLVKRVPALQKMDKSVPQHINYLCFDNMRMMINDREYKFGTLRHYDTKSTNQRVIMDNRSGGVPYDLDSNGLEEESFDGLTPGDIQIRAELDTNGEKQRQRAEVQSRKRSEAHIRFLEANLLAQGEGQEPWEQEMQAHVRNRLDSVRRYSDAREYNRHNILPPQRTFIQLTVSLFGIERFSRGDDKLHNAEKYLASKLFGNAYQNLVHVKRLVIYSDYMTIRLPENLKFKISELQTIGDFPRVFGPLSQVLKDSESLEYLILNEYIRTANDLNHPAIRNAKKLHLPYQISSGLWFEVLSNLGTKVVHFDYDHWSIEEYWVRIENWVRIVQLWVRDNKEVGTCFTFLVNQYESPKKSWCFDIMDIIIEEIGGKKVNKNCITVPMSITSELRLSYEPFTGNKWAMKMEVVRSEQSD